MIETTAAPIMALGGEQQRMEFLFREEDDDHNGNDGRGTTTVTTEAYVSSSLSLSSTSFSSWSSSCPSSVLPDPIPLQDMVASDHDHEIESVCSTIMDSSDELIAAITEALGMSDPSLMTEQFFSSSFSPPPPSPRHNNSNVVNDEVMSSMLDLFLDPPPCTMDICKKHFMNNEQPSIISACDAAAAVQKEEEEVLLLPSQENKNICNNVKILDFVMDQKNTATTTTATSRPGRSSETWDEKFELLQNYRNKYGNTLVPHNWKGNKKLAQWVKRQRYQYKLKKNGLNSTLTNERIQALEDLGFVWSSHQVTWNERWNDLSDYKQHEGHCNVPSTYPKHRQLSVWVRSQRRQYKLWCCGRSSPGRTKEEQEQVNDNGGTSSSSSSMTKERYEKLVSLGFDFNPRKL